ncbi:MAG TPA: RagB/SusD family nutrient uptake outer membrane protein, partial [Chitinophagaceae bacterium]|nr:RagB/SusD family nutrient uptake outer membrane protein [Chitinophagaceae bacterium]
REDFTDYKKLPNTLKGTDCANFIITEINAFSNDLPDGPASKANKDAAKALLMKMYLNKGVYANRAAPTFDPADMQKVIDLADDLIASGKYSLATDYFDNFAPTNDAISTENIYTLYNQNGERGGNMRSRWFMTLHYNQQPSGWNGFTTLSDFYDKFETADIRKGEAYPGVTDVSGVRVGFLYGQQYNAAGTALNDRKGNPLSFTREVALTENGNNLEVTGIRVIKYPIDYSGADQANNDYVIFRYADVLLMKAEALLRTGDAAGALAIVNEVRQARGVADLGSVDLQGLLDERAREFYFEGNRRQDLVRFGKFLDAWQEKPADADSHTLIFPIPNSQLAANANLVQNPGY